MTTIATSPPGRARIISLRVAALAVIGIFLVGSNVVLLFPLFGGLPEATLEDQLEMEPDVLVEVVHGVAIALTHLALILGMLVQLRRPERSIAPLWMCAYLTLAMIVFDISQGTVGNPIWFVVYALVAAVVVLHPRRVARITAVDRPTLVLAIAAAMPMAWYGWNQLRLQFGPADTVGHVEHNHYFTMAGIAGLIIVGAVLGSTDLPGRRLTASIAGLAAADLGIASLMHPENASALATGWALAAIAWGITYIVVVAVRRGLPAGSMLPEAVVASQ